MGLIHEEKNAKKGKETPFKNGFSKMNYRE